MGSGAIYQAGLRRYGPATCDSCVVGLANLRRVSLVPDLFPSEYSVGIELVVHMEAGRVGRAFTLHTVPKSGPVFELREQIRFRRHTWKVSQRGRPIMVVSPIEGTAMNVPGKVVIITVRKDFLGTHTCEPACTSILIVLFARVFSTASSDSLLGVPLKTPPAVVLTESDVMPCFSM